MTETRTINNPKPFCVLHQIARIEKARRNQERAEAFVRAVLCVAFGFALGVLAFSFGGACTM